MGDANSTQKLIRCSVSQNGRLPRTKYIELEFFKAWAYIMLNRHGLVVSGPDLYLWVDMNEYDSHREIYDKNEGPGTVDRVELLISSEQSDSCHAIKRYTPHQNVAEMEKIMISHLGKDIQNSENYQFITTKGYTFKVNNESKIFLLGIEGSNYSPLF